MYAFVYIEIEIFRLFTEENIASTLSIIQCGSINNSHYLYTNIIF